MLFSSAAAKPGESDQRCHPITSLLTFGFSVLSSFWGASGVPLLALMRLSSSVPVGCVKVWGWGLALPPASLRGSSASGGGSGGWTGHHLQRPAHSLPPLKATVAEGPSEAALGLAIEAATHPSNGLWGHRDCSVDRRAIKFRGRILEAPDLSFFFFP